MKKGSFMSKTAECAAITSKVTTPAIDFPTEGETIRPGHYAIRVGAPGATEVQVSVNSNDWQSCRTGTGYHWYDWTPTKSGKCKIIARARANGSDWTKSNIRTCTVVSEN